VSWYAPGVFGRAPVAAGLVVLSAIPLTATRLSAFPALMAAVKRYRADFASKSGVVADLFLLLGALFVCGLMLLPLVRRPRSFLAH